MYEKRFRIPLKVSNLLDISIKDHHLKFDCPPNYEKGVSDKHISRYVNNIYFSIIHTVFSYIARWICLFDLVMFLTFRFQPSTTTCSKLSIKTLKQLMGLVQSLYERHQNKVNDRCRFSNFIVYFVQVLRIGVLF